MFVILLPGFSIQTKMRAVFVAELKRLKNAQEYFEKSNKVLSHFSKYECEESLDEYFFSLEKER